MNSEYRVMNQKEAVYKVVSSVVDIEPDQAVQLSLAQRTSIVDALVDGFNNRSITYAGDVPHGKELRNYCSSLLNNWLRKDTRLNGGVQYVAKNPGSRTGSTDPQIKAMKALLATRSNEAERAEIQAFIDKRIAELKPQTKVEVNVSDLPAELRAKLGI